MRGVSPYLGIEKTTATCYYRALRRSEDILALDAEADTYEHQGRCSCSDGDSAFVRAERAACAADPELICYRATCQIHRICDSRVESFEQEKTRVTSIKRTTLSVRANSGMKTFRKLAALVSQSF